MQSVSQHYGRNDITGLIREGLQRIGKDPSALQPADLAPVDEFHVRGREATLELARLMRLTPAMRVLDIGCGLGGPSRVLAAEYGCHVSGLDITDAYVRAARELARWVGLEGAVDYRVGDALALPFGDGEFDAAITQHVGMNIADKVALYQETHRVLRTGARFGLYDAIAGDGGEVLLPVPWAREEKDSFLIDEDALREALAAGGFVVESWRDTTDLGRLWFAGMAARVAADGPPPLGLHLVMGADFPAMGRNMRRNLEEGRVALVEVVCRRD
jgi:SAM-dependent methyltransferase